MDPKIIEKLKEIVDEINSKNHGLENHNSKNEIVKDSLCFSDSNYKSIDLDETNFHHVRPELSTKKAAFVDGGEVCLLSIPGFSIHFIRSYGHIIHRNQTIFENKSEFYLIVKTISKNNLLFYKTEIITAGGGNSLNSVGQLNFSDLEFDSMDNRLKNGVDRAKTIQISSIIRNIAELKTAGILLNKLESGDLLVFDGTLEVRFDEEKKIIDEIYKKGLEKNVLVSALSKSTDLLTKSGTSIIVKLKRMAPQKIWFYNPIAIINSPYHQAELYFTKLNKHSKHIFRFELYNKQVKLADPFKIFGFLATNSRDLILPGYPYGLIRADQFARVTNNEKEYLKMQILSRIPKELHNLENINNIHDILDNIY